MSKTLEAIISAPSLVREQWLSSELAVREVLAFERRFGSKHLMLACHAALPLILTPELLNLIHINFLEEEQIPWVAEVDFLLSPLCRPIDESLFEVEPAIREVLLVELENQFGWERPFALANFLQFYFAHKSGLKLGLEIIRTQRWIAQAYINPDNLIEELTDLLESSLSEEDNLHSLPEQIQLTTTLELLTEPLERANYREEYRYLVSNLRVLAQLLYGDEQCLKQTIKQEQAQGEIVAKALIVLSPLIRTQLLGKEEEETNIVSMLQEGLEGTEKQLFPLLESLFEKEKIEDLLNEVPKIWHIDKLYTDLSFAKQQLTLGIEKELAPVEKQSLHCLLVLDGSRPVLSIINREALEYIETILDTSNLNLNRYIEVITSQPSNTLNGWRNAAKLLADADYRKSHFSTIRTKIKNTDAEILKASLCDLGLIVKTDADVRGSGGMRFHADIVAVLEGKCDLGWVLNGNGSFDLVADLWGVARKHNQFELINSINQKFAVNKTLAEFKNRVTPIRKPKCPRCESTQIIKYGYYNYKQNYKCQNCGTQFT